MGRRIGPDFSGIRDAMDRIDMIRRRMIPSAASPGPGSFGAELDLAGLSLAESAGEPSRAAPETEKPKDLPALTGSGSVVRSKARSCGDFDRLVSDMSKKYAVDEKLIRSVISVESAWRPDAVSPKGAIGLMQLMPATARMLGVDPENPEENVEGGVKYLSRLSDKYNGDLEKTLAAYNAGPGRVDACDGIPPFRETEAYVRRVLRLYKG